MPKTADKNTDKSEIFSNIASGIQNYVVSLTIILGALWGAIELNLLNKIDLAEAKLTKINAEIEGYQSPQADIKLNKISTLNNTRVGIKANVTLKNHGNKPLLVDLSDSPLVIGKVFFENMKLNISKTRTVLPLYVLRPDNVLFEVDNVILPPKSTKSLAYYSQVDEAGTYMISFTGKVTQKNESKYLTTNEYIYISSGDVSANKQLNRTQKNAPVN